MDEMILRTMIQAHSPRSHHCCVPLTRRFINTSSTKSTRYHRKVRALPFALSPHEAAAKISCPRLLNTAMKVTNLTQTLLREGRIDWKTPLRFTPTETVAIYLPSWFVDVGTSLRITGDLKGQVKQTTFDVAIPQAFLPGHTMDPLCRMSMRGVYKRDLFRQAIPFANNLRRQQKMDVACLPYTLTPLSIDQALVKLVDKTLHVADYMVRMASYPILIPVYLFKYSFKLYGSTVQTFAVAEAASKEGGTIYVKNVMEELLDATGASKLPLCQNLGRLVPEFQTEPPGATAFEMVGAYHGPTASNFQTKLREKIKSVLSDTGVLLHRYAQFDETRRSGANISFDDLRIRQWTKEEVQRTGRYIATTSVLRFIINMDTESTVSGTRHIEQARAMVEKTKPSWLREWEQTAAAAPSRKSKTRR